MWHRTHTPGLTTLLVVATRCKWVYPYESSAAGAAALLCCTHTSQNTFCSSSVVSPATCFSSTGVHSDCSSSTCLSSTAHIRHHMMGFWVKQSLDEQAVVCMLQQLLDCVDNRDSCCGLNAECLEHAAGPNMENGRLVQGVVWCCVLFVSYSINRHTCRSMFSHPSEMFSITVAGLAC